VVQQQAIAQFRQQVFLEAAQRLLLPAGQSRDRLFIGIEQRRVRVLARQQAQQQLVEVAGAQHLTTGPGSRHAHTFRIGQGTELAAHAP